MSPSPAGVAGSSRRRNGPRFSIESAKRFTVSCCGKESSTVCPSASGAGFGASSWPSARLASASARRSCLLVVIVLDPLRQEERGAHVAQLERGLGGVVVRLHEALADEVGEHALELARGLLLDGVLRHVVER